MQTDTGNEGRALSVKFGVAREQRGICQRISKGVVRAGFLEEVTFRLRPKWSRLKGGWEWRGDRCGQAEEATAVGYGTK